MAPTTPPSQGPYPAMPPPGPYPSTAVQPPEGPYPYPYPPQPAMAMGAVNAPGGYAAAPAGAPPGTSSSQPYPAAAPAGTYPPNVEPPSKEKGLQQQGFPPAGYPGAPGMAPPVVPYGGYPAGPAGAYTAAPATGYPVHQAAAPPAAMHVAQPAAIAARPEKCGCSIGWVLFGVGWLFPLCWLTAIFLPLCTRNRNDKRAAIGSGVCLCAYIILIIALAATSPSWRQSGYYYHTRHSGW